MRRKQRSLVHIRKTLVSANSHIGELLNYIVGSVTLPGGATVGSEQITQVGKQITLLTNAVASTSNGLLEFTDLTYATDDCKRSVTPTI